MLTEPWRIMLFNGLTLSRGTQTIHRFRTRKTAEILAYLALNRQRQVPREELAETIWPEDDPQRSRDSLRTALASLRQQLEPPGVLAQSVLHANRVTVGLHPEAVETDVADFEAAVRQFAETPLETRAQVGLEAAALYTGELLSSFYGDWVCAERERLGQVHVDLLQGVVAALWRAERPMQALEQARQLIAADPLCEESYLTAMRLYVACGRSTDALRCFHAWTRLLHDEMGESPSPAIQALAKQIAEACGKSGPSLLLRPQTSKTLPQIPLDPTAVRATQEKAVTPGAERPQPVVRLPLTLNRFFGRETEQHEILHRLLPTADPLPCPQTPASTRLLTLTGPGGTGKTRLSVEVGGSFALRTGQSVTFVPLSELRDPQRLPEVIAAALGLPPTTQGDPLESVIVALRSEPHLLILDNFEQLLPSPQNDAVASLYSREQWDAAMIVYRLLEQVPALRCLVTSRQCLEIEGEQELTLDPMRTPAALSDPGTLMEFACVQLFVDRAQGVRPDFQLTVHNAEAVQAICARLEGLPLALELAATWCAVLSAGQIRERLTQRFDLLVSRRKGRLSRHHTLRAAIAWSYELLSPALQKFFVRLSVFRGGWTVEAAEVICEEPNALACVQALRERSLVVTEEVRDGEGTRIRYRLLETLREFGWEQLSEEDRAELVRLHGAYYVDHVEAVVPLLNGEAQALYQDRLAAEFENFRFILDTRSSAQENILLRLRMAGCLWSVWTNRGNIAEGRRYLEGALAEDAALEPTAARGAALRGAGLLAWYQRDLQTARRYFQESSDLFRRLNDERGAARALGDLGLVAASLQETEQARGYFEACLEYYRRSQNKVGMASMLANLGGLAAERGDFAQMSALSSEALALNRELKNKSGIIHLLQAIGESYLQEGRPRMAYACFEESLTLLRELRDVHGIVHLLHKLAPLLGPTSRAVRLAGAAQALNEVSAGAPLAEFSGEALARRTMGDRLYATFWAEGRALPLPQAVQEALDAVAELGSTR